MPATLDSSLVDQLVASVVDPLRAVLYPITGIRAYNVNLVRRRWSGPRRDMGTPTIVSDIRVSPPPKVSFENNREALHYEAESIGRTEEGECNLTEVSLQYSESDLTGSPIAANEEFYYRITDAHGQQIKTRYFVPDQPPRPDREKDIGWVISLRRVEIEE